MGFLTVPVSDKPVYSATAARGSTRLVSPLASLASLSLTSGKSLASPGKAAVQTEGLDDARRNLKCRLTRQGTLVADQTNDVQACPDLPPLLGQR